jgi:hypothetical protein
MCGRHSWLDASDRVLVSGASTPRAFKYRSSYGEITLPGIPTSARTAGGASGWCWHNGDNRAAKDGQPRRSFYLREQRLFAQLDEEERRALPLLSEVMAGAARDAGAKKPAAGG